MHILAHLFPIIILGYEKEIWKDADVELMIATVVKIPKFPNKYQSYTFTLLKYDLLMFAEMSSRTQITRPCNLQRTFITNLRW